jgi:hypothetical protein
VDQAVLVPADVGQIVGRLLDAGTGYGPVFAAVSTFHVIAFCLILLTIRKIQPLSLRVERAGVLV